MRIVLSKAFVAPLALLLLAPAAFAATFTVNPTCTTNGNGTSSSCATSSGGVGAWKSLDNVTCGTNGLKAGDILNIKGGTYGRWQYPQTCSGASGNPIIIQNAAGEAVVFDGTKDIRTSTWTAVGGGVYQCTSGTCGTSSNHPFTAWYKRGSNAEERLNLIQSNRTCDSSVPAGYYRYTTGGQVCAHLPDGSSPASTAYFKIPSDYMGINLAQPGTGPHWVTIRKNPAGGSFTIQRFLVYGIALRSDNVGITYDGLDVGWVMDRCLDDSNVVGAQTNANHVVKNCNVHHCGQEGIRIDSDKGSGFLIEGNDVHDIQTSPLFERCRGVGTGCFNSDQGTGIRVARSANGRVVGNTIHDSGGGFEGRFLGIDMENGCENQIIENNYIYNVHVPGAVSPSYGKGIVLSSLAGGNYTGCTVRNNRVFKADSCINLTAGGNITTGPTSIYSNTCAESYWAGIELETNVGVWSGAINFANNLLINTTTTPTFGLVYIKDSDSGYTKPTYGAYYCANCTAGAAMINWHGTTYKRAGDCSPGTNCVADFESHSVYGDPNVDETGPTPTLRLTACSGSACNQGTSLTSFTFDYLGGLRPQGNAWDIGAHEFGASGSALSPPLLIDVSPVP